MRHGAHGLVQALPELSTPRAAVWSLMVCSLTASCVPAHPPIDTAGNHARRLLRVPAN